MENKVKQASPGWDFLRRRVFSNGVHSFKVGFDKSPERTFENPEQQKTTVKTLNDPT